MRSESDITYFARTNFRGIRRRFGIRRADRRYHMYILGRTGMGKSSLIATLVRQDLLRGEGLALIDPHGDLAEGLVAAIPTRRAADTTYLDVADPSQSVHFNPLSPVPESERPLVAANLVDAFKRIWSDSWGVRMEHILRNILLTLLDQPAAGVADILRILTDDDYRERAVGRTANREASRFWSEEFRRYGARMRVDALGPIQNKISALLSNPVIARVLTARKSSFDCRRVMDEGKVLLVNLGKGRIGEGPALLVGALLTAQLGAAGLSRSDVEEHNRRDFYLYLDEFQSYTTGTLASMLAELRKYRVSLVLANQHLSQVDKQISESILANAGTTVAFRLGPTDARVIAQELAPVFPPVDLMNLGKGQVYLRLMIDGIVSRPFSADTTNRELILPTVSSHTATP